ncbi:MAG: hypothetical protein MNPFHGCM_02970 [Gemmatimonadaceae bacterium]|nr:hypothetical protein [Gemmatimonadaceae bacterium]
MTAVFLLALQALLWIGGPIVDGRNEAASAGTQTHVEELGGTKCPRAHSHLDCLICRTLAEGVILSASVALLPVGLADDVALYRTAVLPTRADIAGVLGPRAPPVA